jgi:hypothetical protein
MQYPALKTVRAALSADEPPAASQQQRQQPPPTNNNSSSSSNQLQPLIAPSILAADFADMAAELAKIEAGGADWVHVDMLDGTDIGGGGCVCGVRACGL